MADDLTKPCENPNNQSPESRPSAPGWRPWVWLLVGLLVTFKATAAQTNIVFLTEFEASEGYDGQYTLVGQQGWLGEGTGGNGLVTNFFTGFKQQAFLGYFPPETNDTTLSVWYPINYVPTPGGNDKAYFFVSMSVIDSSNGYYDEFRWSVYNAGGENALRLFTLNFDNSTFQISYSLDNTNGFVATGFHFTNALLYELVIEMDFGANLWNAFLDQDWIVRDQPMTTTGAPLSLGDVDAVWAVNTPNHPGDNYLLFDNYQVDVVVPTLPEPEASLEYAGRLSDGQFIIRMKGPPGKDYALEYTTNFKQWSSLKTNTVPSDGWLDFLDVNAPLDSQRFYRTRLVGGN